MDKLEQFFVWVSKPGTNTMPYLYEMCIASWQIMNPRLHTVIYVSNPNITFNFLSKDTTEVRIIPQELMEKAERIMSVNKLDNMRFAHLCDYIRYSILSERCGVALDCDMICIKPIEDMLKDMYDNGGYIVESAEDANNRIGNAFMTNLNMECVQFYKDILNMYETNYVRTSYTFNSIKYPILLRNRYRDMTYVLPWKYGMFFPNWADNEDLELLKTPNCSLQGYAVHLYSSNNHWNEIREIITDNMYTDNLDWWIIKHLNRCIETYISEMCHSEYRQMDTSEEIYQTLKDVKGEDYMKKLEVI